MAEWRMSAPLPEEQDLLHASPRTAPPCSLATLTRGSCLAVDRQDHLKAAPLSTAMWSASLAALSSDRTVARRHCRSGPWRPRPAQRHTA
jgi:hypothetical protein